MVYSCIVKLEFLSALLEQQLLPEVVRLGPPTEYQVHNIDQELSNATVHVAVLPLKLVLFDARSSIFQLLLRLLELLLVQLVGALDVLVLVGVLPILLPVLALLIF